MRRSQLIPGQLVNSVAAGIAHHRATAHPGGGAGEDYWCDTCPFEVVDSVVIRGGAIEVVDAT